VTDEEKMRLGHWSVPFIPKHSLLERKNEENDGEPANPGSCEK